MLYYLTAVGLVAHTFFWGLGPALLVLPRKWRRWAWLFAPGLGFALQSAAVWAGAHTALAGTDAYARWSELIPLALLVVALVRRPPRMAWRTPGLLAIVLVGGWLLTYPMTKPGRGLTSSSLGNCDPADYAAGARVFREFSRNDRTGFLGLPEVTKVRSVDYFFDFWVRLNHFTPSALIAHNASVFGVESYRLVSISAVAILLLNLPVVLLLGRLMIGLRGLWLAGFVALYAFSPLNAYAVDHGQLGQLYAAQGIALLTLTVFGASRWVRAGRNAWAFFPLLLAAFWLLAGSYNFILTVCLAPAGAWLCLQFWRRRDWKALGKILSVIAVALGAGAILFWGRFDGLVERFSLFNQYDFGWPIPLFSPEGLLGILRDTSLHAWPLPIRGVLGILVAGLWLAGLVWLWRRGKFQASAAFALVVPVMAGWAVLAWGSRARANSSYDAYKLVSVFLPGLMAGLLCWLSAIGRRGRGVKAGAACLLVFLLGGNLWVGEKFRSQMSAPPLRVNRDLAGLIALEKDPRFGSFNMLIDDYWSRLWANAFLLRKPQYFLIHTYEGRLNTTLKGEWNLSDSLLHPVPLHAEDFVRYAPPYFLVRASALGGLSLAFAGDWYPEEKLGSIRWRWSNGRGRIRITNPSNKPVRIRLQLDIRSFQPDILTLRLGEKVIATKPLDGTNETVEVEDITLPPGPSILALDGEGVPPGAGDARRLAFALYGLETRVLFTGD